MNNVIYVKFPWHQTAAKPLSQTDPEPEYFDDDDDDCDDEQDDGTNCEVVCHFDVWGNSKSGWEVNDCNRRRMKLDTSSNRALLKGLRTLFEIPNGSVKIDQTLDLIEITEKNGKPFLTITLD